jgi:preprotein translocase subunit SecA
MIKKNSRYNTLINEINLLENKFKGFTNEELKETSLKFQKHYKVQKNLSSILIESFAITRETANRSLGLRPYDVQLFGGLVLNEGKIVEIGTGEGKTLVATLPAVLNAFTNKGVHIVTVNDYLANRDKLTMSQLYTSLNLSTGLIQNEMLLSNKRLNYRKKITYVTNSELGFDYLRDNMASTEENLMLSEFNFVIIDEVDSILIDEARTPLILSGPIETPINKYLLAAEVAKFMKLGVHFNVEEKSKNIILLEKGILLAEQILLTSDLYNKKEPWISFILNAIKANTLFFNNINYMTKNNEILIIDEFSGRVMPNRRWSDGLHQAIEVKENLPIRKNSEILASITYQNFFKLYPKLSGMTGTAKTADVEFLEIYNLEVIEIPRAIKSKRLDLPDEFYKNELFKWFAISEECLKVYKTSQPILIGTTTVNKSEIFSQFLKYSKLPHQILNAKPENVRKESKIIAQAGKKYAITIATNMAGRGTDIILGGNVLFKVHKLFYDLILLLKNYKNLKRIHSRLSLYSDLNKISIKIILKSFEKLSENEAFLQKSNKELLELIQNFRKDFTKNRSTTEYINELENIFLLLFNFLKIKQKQDNFDIRQLGGLYIIGTERHESVRIDNQLRGRCARQGDPGITKFFLSVEDTLVRLFGGEQLFDQLTNNKVLLKNLFSKTFDVAQQNIENQYYESRKFLFEYDQVLNGQRKIIYKQRKDILMNNTSKFYIIQYIEQFINDVIQESQITDINILKTTFSNIIGKDILLSNHLSTDIRLYKDSNTFKSLITEISYQFWITYCLEISEFDIFELGLFSELERIIILKSIDINWKLHLQLMAELLDGITWRSYGQYNPLFEYKDEAYKIFTKTLKSIRQTTLYEILKLKIE